MCGSNYLSWILKGNKNDENNDFDDHISKNNISYDNDNNNNDNDDYINNNSSIDLKARIK